MSNRVYILGAGSSCELKFNISNLDLVYPSETHKLKQLGPLSSGYFYYMNKLLKEVEDKNGIPISVNINRSLLPYILNYYKKKFKLSISKNDILENEEISKKINIEELYKNIESDAEKSDEKSQLIDYAAISYLKKYIHDTLSTMSYYCLSLHHDTFAKYVLQHGGDIISFNWDILFDEAMMYNSWNYKTGYGIEFKDIIYKSDYPTPQNSKNLILKPHGSINWYGKWDKTIEEVDDMYLVFPKHRGERGGDPGGRLKRIEFNDRVKEYFGFGKTIFSEISNDNISKALEYEQKILKGTLKNCFVPPGKKRKIKTFEPIWNKMTEVLEKAEEIIAIGFSFNDNDSHVKDAFQDINFKNLKKISLVNPDGKDLIELYKEVFKTNNAIEVEKQCDKFSEYCNFLKSI